MKTKICIMCHKEKSLNDFHFRKDNNCYRKKCKDCRRKQGNKYYSNNKQERAQYYQINKLKILNQKKIFYLDNKNRLLDYRYSYIKLHKTEIQKYQKIYKIKNKKRLQTYNKLRAKRMRKTLNKNKRIRTKRDRRFHISSNLRTRIYSALKGETKSLSTMFLVGCEIDYLLYYLQNKFTKDMNWDNYGRGGWEVDHIKPCSKFHLSKPEEQQKCFHYTNLQPLWFKENRSKGNKYNP